MKKRNFFLTALLVFTSVLIFALGAAGGDYPQTAFLGRGQKTPPLQTYNVDPATVSVSGISSGGFMAVQVAVAYSSVFPAGLGVFAGGPYDCARNQHFASCMKNSVPDISRPRANMVKWSGGGIDPLTNLAQRRIYLWVGQQDDTVGPNVVKSLNQQLSSWYNPENVNFRVSADAAHTFPTDFDSPGNNACGSAEKPFISNCGYDGAGEALKWFYGKLNSRNEKPASSGLKSFDQAPFAGKGKGMDDTGYIYVPASCAAGRPCRLHVALHGCGQSRSDIETQFALNTGYNKWADTNGIIVVYPQAKPDYMFHRTWSSGYLNNPLGCWDWIGWYGDNADRHGGAQVEAIVDMVRKITSGRRR